MPSYTLYGIQITMTDFDEIETVTRDVRLTLPTGADTIRYSITSTNEGALPNISFGDSVTGIALRGPLENLRIEDFSLGQVASDSRRHIMLTYTEDNAPETRVYLFPISGDPLPALNTPEDVIAFLTDLRLQAGPVSSGLFAPNRDIPLSEISNVSDFTPDPPSPPNPGDNISGTEGDETLIGTDADDTISGNGGDDLLAGGEGNDTLNGSDGNDVIAAAVGNDVANGDAGNDNMGGGLGNDTMAGGTGNDLMGGGQGEDIVNGGADNDVVNGGTGNDTLDGGTGNDTMGGSFGRDLVNGGDGDDDMGGGRGRDTIDGGAGNDSAGGGEDNDFIFGGDGNDFLAGGGRNDLINGGAGDDTITGGDGDDIMDGGTGADQFNFNRFNANECDAIENFEDGTDIIRMSGLDNGGNGLQGFVDALNITDTADGAQMTVEGHTIVVVETLASELGIEDFVFL